MRRLVLSLAFLATACTQPAAPDTPGPSAEVPAPHGQSSTEPLVLAVHASLPAPRLSRSKAERVAETGRWRGVEVRVLPASRVTPFLRPALVDGIDPLTRPGDYPLRTAGPKPQRPVTVTVVGDLMLGRGVADPLATLLPFRRRLSSADLTLGNLESTLSTAGPPQQGGDSFAAPPSVLSGLADAGFDAVSLANNHTGDFGERALLDTVAALGRGPVRAFGAGNTRRQASRPFVREVNGVRFGVVGFNAIGETPQAAATTPGALSVRMPPRTGPLNRDDLHHLLAVVRRLDQQVDVVLVLPHWGTQYTHVAEPSQRYVGRRLVDAGADLVVGGHPHWVQGLESHRGAVIAHSLGNFVFDMDFMTETMQGVVLEATFWGATLKRVELVPYVMDARFVPRPVSGALAVDILRDVWRHSTGRFAVPRR